MIKHVNNKNFDNEVLNSKKAILVDFFATWCGPCQMLTPVLEGIANTRADFDIAKINIDEAQDLAIKYGVEVVPTLLVFKNGSIINKIEGYVDENTIVNEMLKHI